MIKKQCAIYTRKSHADGLEQDFNSLDAQREACEAFIQSQKHEGWQCKKGTYDDGAYSGGTLKRPAITQLLKDIADGHVQVIVVYKVDRLTRSLADFAKLIELFDKHDVSFVSVTQQFNTTSSMGRLTLNVLLSFAQFEREITGERIRDKFLASKQKGMWMGGTTPLGYDVKDRALHINQEEAKTIELIFSQYLRLGNVKALKQYLDKEGVISKVRKRRDGSTHGGVSISRGGLYKKLSNPTYKGDIKHKNKTYPGKQDAIINDDTWEKVQALLKKNNKESKSGVRAKHPSLLAGKLFDDTGHPMSPSHAVKNGKRYRYYTSQAHLQQASNKAGSLSRIPATEIEQVVIKTITDFLMNPLELSKVITEDIEGTSFAFKLAEVKAKQLSKSPDSVRELLIKTTVTNKEVRLSISATALHTLLELALPSKESPIVLIEKTQLKRCQGENKLIISDSTIKDKRQIRPSLLKALSRAYVWNEMLITNEVKSVREIARLEGVTGGYVKQILALINISPSIVNNIIEGSQPADLTLNNLHSMTSQKWITQYI